ncbi:4Fe-4S binding protein [Chitinilyticum litopenaei]|uniref:4Fe-4S binding protein n=2 Tax=Chitinilyticum piscinae TaxID=2866724 RepID=A0A8J7K356_9NEIS|nr:4Fe-4S binding protein [Chitinilyticum piscinae]
MACCGASRPVRQRFPARFGDVLRDHAHWLRRLQWLVVLVYLALLVIPAILPLPPDSARAFDHVTVAAQFMFWGIWWPFVLLSMVLMGRAWCGWLCPEGMLAEWSSERGRGGAIPRWIRWEGWPFLAFVLTTLYGQLVSVYQYPKAALLVLGGSTVAAMLAGYWYGRNKRVWCRYLCPVNGVFHLLAKLAPWHYRVDSEAWRKSKGQVIIPINCAPLVPLAQMKGAAQCHMCGRCSGYRDAIELAVRSPENEIVHVAHGDKWQARLILTGMMGIAVGAFQWSASPHLVSIKQALAAWLIERDVYWPLDDSAPWWLLTHYPELNDSFSWLDGALIAAYILGGGMLLGLAYAILLRIADACLPGKTAGSWTVLAQSFIPAAGCGVFLGLSMTTLTLLRHEGVSTGWAGPARAILLAVALLWSLRLFWRLAARRGGVLARRLLALLPAAAALALFGWQWVLLFWRW